MYSIKYRRHCPSHCEYPVDPPLLLASPSFSHCQMAVFLNHKMPLFRILQWLRTKHTPLTGLLAGICFLLGFHPWLSFSPCLGRLAGLLAVPQAAKCIAVSGPYRWSPSAWSALSSCQPESLLISLKSLLKWGCPFLKQNHSPLCITLRMGKRYKLPL